MKEIYVDKSSVARQLALLEQNGYFDIRLIADYNGNDRVVTGRWDG